MKKTIIDVEGMHCKSCETLIKEALADVGVKAKPNHKKVLLNFF
ncbi:hypothetical protein GOV08_04030 [Candidatus Woesearchaeota archaeon]|nr:hypothetical protein [Candidatus Woesearchaeota archaeon]